MPSKNAKIIYMRKSIIQALTKIWEYPLTVVEAPMGYGKTTAVREFFNGSRAEVLWQTISDDSVSSFWHGFSRLFRKIDPAAADRLAELGAPLNNIFMEAALNIVEAIDFPARTVIGLDDYHLLASADVDSFIELLIKSELPHLHIVIVSRSVFGESTTELVLKGYCLVIGKGCFELYRDEIVEYCGLCGVKLNAEETAFLLSYTEGWISAVYLCMLGFLQDGRIERQASLHELIEKVVYRRTSAEVKGFLLNVCIFDSFSLAQAEYMWQEENAEALLRRLMIENAFIKYDHVSQRYYMHNILTSYLRQVFDRQVLDKRQVTWKTAGEWYLSVGDYIHAMEFFYKAADYHGLMTVIETDKGNSICHEHKERMICYFHDCPPRIKQEHPWACLIYAINLFSFNEMELFAEECAEIRGYIKQLRGDEEQAQEKLTGELEILISFAKYNSITGMSEHHQRAWSLLRRPAEFIDRNGSWTFGSPSVLYMFYRESGQLEQEVHDMNVAMPLYCRLTAGHGSGAEYVMQAERYYHIGDFENAEIAAHKAMYISQAQKQMAIELCALFLQLRLALVKGDLAFVMDTLRQTQAEIKGRRLYAYIHTWDLCEGFVYSYLNQANKIPGWVVKGDLRDSAVCFPSWALVNIIRAKALLIGSQYLKLVGLAEEFIAIASVFPNLLGQVYIYIYEAAAKFKLGRREEARETLQKALDIAAPDRVMMPFVENSEYIVDMLIELEKNGHYPEFIGRIREFWSSINNTKDKMRAKLDSGDRKYSLTEREWAITELVAAGLSNRAIGETLYIAEVTVKKALQNIFAKLSINSRTALTKIIIEQRTS